jgi:hypothetical protein
MHRSLKRQPFVNNGPPTIWVHANNAVPDTTIHDEPFFPNARCD